MKKIIVFLVSCVVGLSLFAADQWDKTAPASTINPATLSTVIGVNNSALDRFLQYGRFSTAVQYASASTLTVSQGSIVCSNSSGTIRKLRTNTSATSVSWSDLDTGAEAASTTYYLYAVSDTDADTFTIKISASGSAPTGCTYYRYLASFYNNANSNIDASSISNINDYYGHNFGNPVAKTVNVVYQATTDGSVTAYNQYSLAGGIYAYCDSANPPTTLVSNAYSNITSNNWGMNLHFHVKKGNYYEVTYSDRGNIGLVINWIPEGN
jgi:hypothetical protein